MRNKYAGGGICLPLFIGLWCGAVARAEMETNEPSGDLSLAQAQRLVEARHPALRAAELESEAANTRVAQAALRPNPRFSVEAENFGGRDAFSRFDGAEYTAQLEQTIELGGKRGARVRVAETEKRLADFDRAARRLDIRAQTTRRFTALLGAQERLSLSKEAVAMAEAFVQAVASRVKAGKAPPMEEDKARILLAQQETGRDHAERGLRAARIQLSALWGSGTPVFDRAAGELSAIPPVTDLTTLVGRLKASPELARRIGELDQRKAALDQERVARAPDVAVAGGIRRYSDTDGQAFVAALSMDLPLFDRNREKIRAAALLVEKAEQERQSAEAVAVAALAEAYHSFSAVLAKIARLEDDVIPRAKSVFEAVRNGYTEGKFSCLDVLDARRTFFDARVEHVEALVAGHQARADVEQRVGDATPATTGH